MEDKILLVDDEEGVRRVLHISLADAGYRVFEAADGSEALEIFKKENPSIVLTDIKMPGMDGVDLLRRIKHENPEVEVIMITGHGDMDLAIRSLKHDASDFITKPINDDILNNAVNKARERRIIREKLREYTESLETLVREKSALQDRLSSLGLRISSVSHGIKGLLTALDGSIYLVDSGLSRDDPAQVRDGWETVKTMVERIRNMVLDILFYAKEREMTYETVRVGDLSREVAAVVESTARDKGVEFVCDIDGETGDLRIDPGYFRSALVNILENAVDACIRDDTKESHCIRFATKADNGQVRFDISDTGVGMDTATREKIFELFYSSKGREGTGLGLFIARKVIEEHGGSIHVSSHPGKGSRFIVTIPRGLPNNISQ